MKNPRDDEPQLVVVRSEPPHGQGDGTDQPSEEVETIGRPAKVMRIGSMIRQLLEEARQAPLDEASRIRLREIYDTSLNELQEGLSPDLAAELVRMAPPFHPEAVPTESELRVAQAQLVGWLEGLFHGIQATLYAQQMAQRAQVEEMRRRGLPSGPGGHEGPEQQPPPGTYL
ncbi:MAG: bacterial proteasome activator family protein [Acidimicrobiales bacterium]